MGIGVIYRLLEKGMKEEWESEREGGKNGRKSDIKVENKVE